MPSTQVPGVNRDAVLRVLMAPSDRRVGALLPVTVDVVVAAEHGIEGQVLCVRLASDPGSVIFPFGSACPAASGSSGGGAGGSDAGVGGDSGGGGGGGTASAGGAEATLLALAHACLPLRSGEGGLHSRAIGAYSPKSSETIVTFFASLYRDASCSGLAWTETAVNVQLGGAAPTDAGTSSSNAGGAGGAPVDQDAAPDAGADAESGAAGSTAMAEAGPG